MDKTDIILIGGIILACIWLMTYIIIEDDKKRRIILATGAIIDLILYFIGKNSEFLLVGIVGGIIFSFVPARGRKARDNAIKESKGLVNYMAVMVIFFVMILMFVTIAYPGVEFSWK